ncbi:MULTISPECIES: DinB family protein [Deinococcus]|uniref:DinB family protein n=1 Tax=Deinococcus cavernae TaxID=2320857 RepID=A0A418V7Y8_9DEIO|nr:MULTISPECIES: DinB family protein [Deinococcus]RJF72218.1 DinB family protein [Deinococcus cavernae]
MLNAQAEADFREINAQYGSGAELSAQLAAELQALEGVIRRAGGEGWQQVRPGCEWSPAQEAEHIVLANEGSSKVIRLLLSDKPIPDMPQKYTDLKDGKRLAPPGTVPTGEATPEDLLARIAASREWLSVPVDASSERKFFHPAFGLIDPLGWLRVTAGHTRHHRERIEAGIS